MAETHPLSLRYTVKQGQYLAFIYYCCNEAMATRKHAA